MSTESHKALIQRHYAEIWNAHNPDAADAFYAVDTVEHNPPVPDLPSGNKGARAIFATFINAFPDVHFMIDALVAEDDMVACRWTSTGTHTGALLTMPPTGRQATITGMDLFHIVNGKITEHWGNFDQFGLLQQLNSMPSPV